MSRSRHIVDLRRQKSRSAPEKVGRLPFSPKTRMPLRARRRRIRFFIACVCFVLFGAGAWGLSWVSYLPQINVRVASVSGTEHISPRLVEALATAELSPSSRPFFSPTNIILFNPSKLARAIALFFPRVKSAVVSRHSLFSADVDITVIERHPFALWCDKDARCYESDETGYIFAKAPSADDATTTFSTRYIFSSGLSGPDSAATSSDPIGKSFTPGHLPGLSAFLGMLDSAGFQPQGATVTNDQDFFVPLREGFFIKASFGANADFLTRNLQLVLASDALQGRLDQLEYVDLRFGNRVYYKLKGASEASAAQ